jgi:multidrug efflux pump subunit AcrA (membrane-fusion protein)
VAILVKLLLIWMGNAVHPENENSDRRSGSGLLAGTPGPPAHEPSHLSVFYVGQPPPRPERDYPPVRPPGQVASSPSATLTVSRPAHQADPPEATDSIRSARTWPQRAGGILIAAAVVASAIWYIPSVLRDNRQLLTGTVASSGVITLNFSNAGEISEISAKLNTPVQKGQILAREYAPDTASRVAADNAAIAADKAKMAQVREAEAVDPANDAIDSAQLAAANAQLALDQAQLATDQEKIVSAEIVAPSAGVIVAANGQVGQTVTTSGIRDYQADSQEQSAAEGPAFSLLPEGPQTGRKISASASAVPVFALRTSVNWQVIVLIPESAVARVRAGQRVAISVPSDHVKDVPGQVSDVLPTPTPTSAGVVYQAVVNITGHAANVPLNGMTADVALGT